MAMVRRLMIQIDEDKCNGCGLCVPGCAEGALAIIDGKAKVVSETFCDGLGACLGHCPEGALTLLEVDTVEFDMDAATEHVARTRGSAKTAGCPGEIMEVHDQAPSHFSDGVVSETPRQSELRQWPIKMRLVNPQHSALREASLLLLADCSAVAYAGLHQDFLAGKAIIQLCPKFTDYTWNLEKLMQIFQLNDIKDISIVHMEVPCCSGLVRMAREAMEKANKQIPLRAFMIGVRGEIKAVT